MIFGSFRLLFSLIIFLIESIYFLIIFIFKFLFNVIAFLFKFTCYIITNKYLRFPTILFTVGFITSTKVIFIFTIYYIYLIHIFALKHNIYLSIKSFLINMYDNIKKRVMLNRTFKKLSCKYKIIKNTFLEDEDELVFLSYFIVTEKALYNLIPYDYALSFKSKNVLNNASKVTSFISSILTTNIPLINILLIYDSFYEELVSDFPYKTINVENLIPYIDESPYKKYKKSIDEIYYLITENRLWFIDKLILNTSKFIIKYKKAILLTILCPLIYCIYILSLLFLIDTITIFAQDSIHKITEAFNSFHY